MVTTRPPKTIVKPTALGPVANTDTKLLIYGLFQKGRVLAQDGVWEQTFGANSAKLARARFPTPCSLARTPVPDPWRAFGRNPARSGCHGERDTKLRRSRRVRFCRHPSRPEWNGRTYQVEVVDNGYRFDGKTYPSLTAITKRITGTPSCAKTRPFCNRLKINS